MRGLKKKFSQVPEYLVFFSPSGVSYTMPLLKEYNLITNVKVIRT